MTTHVEVRTGAYADSVALLEVSRTLQRAAGVQAGQVAMGTPLNLELLTGMGFDLPADVTANDLVVAVRLDADGDLDRALAVVEQALRPPARGTSVAEVAPPRTTRSALSPGAVALVSVPGSSATVEAMDALDGGCDVMVFSDHVPVEEEVALKQVAQERDLLVMGPDCGTAVVDGLGLGFANVTAPGPVGVVAASGTGCQQLVCLLDEAGVGISSALGVGGRDLSAAVGGISTRTALARLDADPRTELIVVVSKPPAPEVAAELEEYAATLATPVELALLGPGQPDLTAAAERVLSRLGRDVPTWPVVEPSEALRPAEDGRRLRGLFVGGTHCQEAAVIAEAALGPLESAGHTLVDYGDDEFTEGRAHPMIDPTLRLAAIEAAAADPTTGVLLLDVVLGHGAEPDPAAGLLPVLSAIDVPVVVALVGTAHDPQGRDRQASALSGTGAEVHLSNAAATRRALDLIGGAR